MMHSNEKQQTKYLIWQLLLFVAVGWTAIEVPLSFVLDIHVKESHLWWDGIISFLFLTDVALNLGGFYSGRDEQSSLSRLEVKKTKPYSKSIWLPIDVISSIPFDILAVAFGFHGVFILRIFRLLRLARVLKMVSLFHSTNLLPHGYKVTLIVSSVLIAIHWIACAWMYISPIPEVDPYTFYNKSLYWAITTLTTIGYGDITPTTNGGRIFTMVIMILGVGTYGIIIGNVSRLIINADRYKEAKKERLHEMGHFMKHYHIPLTLQRQVFSFYHHLLDKRLSDKDNAIINDLPQALQSEMQVYMRMRLVKNVHIFQDSTVSCLKLISEKLQQAFYSPSDLIIKNGDKGEKMFIIAHGEVEVLDENEKVFATLKDGQFFGEIALIEDCERTADVRAKTYCDLYTLHKDDFQEIVERFPKLGEKFETIYKKRKTDRKLKKAS